MKQFIYVLLFLGLSTAGLAQNSVISGKIKDKDGNPVVGAEVHFLNSNSGAATNETGQFSLAALPPGTYTLEISAVGFASFQRSLIVPSTGEVTPLDFTLSESLTQLDDVVVTAQKREEGLAVVPAAVSSISARQVQEFRLWNSKDITAIVPNLYSSNPGDGRNVTSVRGITSTSYDPSVATYIDGVNQFGLDTYIAQLFDVERIEVLRGPQGTLYGRNAMGGVINIITKQPSNTTDGFVETNSGNYNQQRVAVAVRTPLVKNKLFFGVSGVYDHTGGFYTNQAFSKSSDSYHFDRKHSFTGNYYLKYYASDKWQVSFNLKHNQNRNYGAFPLAYVNDVMATPFQLNQDAVARMVDNIFNTSLSLSYTGAKFNFSSQSAYQSNYRYYVTPIDGDFSPIDAVSIRNNYGRKWNNVKVLTQEFKFTSPSSSSSPLRWTAGSYLFYQYNPVKQAIHYGRDGYLIGAPDSLSTISTSTGKSFGAALFGQATWSITEKFDITAGLRYDYEHKRLSGRNEYQADTDAVPTVTQPDTTATASFHAVSPKLIGAWHATEKNMVFGSYTRGYRAGGISPLAPDSSSLRAYQPEYSNNFEVGARNTFFENRLRINLSAFYIHVNNAQVAILSPTAVTVTSNVGKLNSKGVEVELSATPVKGLQLDYNLGVNHARYTSFLLPGSNQSSEQQGKRQLFSPSGTQMTALQYSVVLKKSSQLRFVMRGEWIVIGKTYYSYDASAPIVQRNYNLLNLRTGIAARRFEVMFWMRNIGNKKYIDYAYTFGAAHLGNPRNLGVTLRMNF